MIWDSINVVSSLRSQRVTSKVEGERSLMASEDKRGHYEDTSGEMVTGIQTQRSLFTPSGKYLFK